MYKMIVAVLMIGVVGCSTVVERDFEKEEQEYIKKYGEAAKKDPLYAAPTEATIVAGNTDQVTVTLYKDTPTKNHGMELQTWQASIFNHNDHPVCALVHWKLMDFELITDYPDFTFIDAHGQIFKYATMRQQIWNLDGTKFALPPSGYIETMIIRKPNPNSRRGQECVFETKVDEK